MALGDLSARQYKARLRFDWWVDVLAGAMATAAVVSLVLAGGWLVGAWSW